MKEREEARRESWVEVNLIIATLLDSVLNLLVETARKTGSKLKASELDLRPLREKRTTQPKTEVWYKFSADERRSA